MNRPLAVLFASCALAAALAARAGAFRPPRDLALALTARAGPAELEGRLDGPARETARGWRTTLRFDAASGPQRALVWLPRGRGVDDLSPGRRVAVTGLLRPPRRPRDPGDFDEEAALRAQGAGWVLHARAVAVASEPVPGPWRPWAWAQDARLAAERAFRRRLTPGRAALLAGLTLGDAGALPRDLRDAVRDAGATHLLVASGSNVGFAAAAGAGLALAAGAGPPLVGAAALACAGFYTLMAGGDPPCARAWLMLAAAVLARLLGRLAPASACLTAAAFALLLLDPAAALSPSGVMSVGACAAVLAAGGRVERALPPAWPWPRTTAAATLAALTRGGRRARAGLGGRVRALLLRRPFGQHRARAVVGPAAGRRVRVVGGRRARAAAGAGRRDRGGRRAAPLRTRLPRGGRVAVGVGRDAGVERERAGRLGAGPGRGGDLAPPPAVGGARARGGGRVRLRAARAATAVERAGVVGLWIANWKLLPETLHLGARQPFKVRHLLRGYWHDGQQRPASCCSRSPAAIPSSSGTRAAPASEGGGGI